MASNPESLTPDAALLEEAEKLISALHPGSGRGTVYRLIKALRASLDREREMQDKLDTRDRQMSDNMYLAMVEGERVVLRRERDALAAELQRLKEGKS